MGDKQSLADGEQTLADTDYPTAEARLNAASTRDATADARDLAALARDNAADARTLTMTHRDASCEHGDDLRAVTGAEIVMRAAGARRQAATHRGESAEQRLLATQDREGAAEDREQAAGERRLALVDREALALQVAIAQADRLTGARARAAGLSDLDHELVRCRRTSGLLVVAYVDIVGLKSVNDIGGHPAGDRLLKRVVQVIKEHLRPYDLVIRLGGDEFLFAMSDMTLVQARQRFSVIAAALAAAPAADALSVGFAELAPRETVTELIARAASELTDRRRNNHARRPKPGENTSAGQA